MFDHRTCFRQKLLMFSLLRVWCYHYSDRVFPFKSFFFEKSTSIECFRIRKTYHLIAKRSETLKSCRLNWFFVYKLPIFFILFSFWKILGGKTQLNMYDFWSTFKKKKLLFVYLLNECCIAKLKNPLEMMSNM